MSYDSEVLADTPTAYWKLAEASGTTVNDSSGNGHNGTYSGSPTLGQPGLLTSDPDTCVTLNGSNYASVPSVPTTSSYTVECWIKTTTTSRGVPATRDAHGAGNGFVVDFNYTVGRVEFGNFGSGFAAPTSGSLNDGHAHHIVGVRDGTAGTFSLYVDGALLAGPASFSDNTTANGTVWIGERGDGTIRYIGSIEKVALYPAALSATRIAAHYTAGTSGGGTDVTLAGPVATATTAAPAGTVGIDCTIAGTVTTVTVAAPAGTVSTTANLAGPVATTITAAPAGTVTTVQNITLTGPAAAITSSAPAGTAGAAQSVTITGTTASTTTASPAGTIRIDWTATANPAAAAVSAPAGTGSYGCTITGSLATITITAPAGTIGPIIYRDLNLTAATGSDRWTATIGHDRWTATTGTDRWAATTTPEGS